MRAQRASLNRLSASASVRARGGASYVGLSWFGNVPYDRVGPRRYTTVSPDSVLPYAHVTNHAGYLLATFAKKHKTYLVSLSPFELLGQIEPQRNSLSPKSANGLSIWLRSKPCLFSVDQNKRIPCIDTQKSA